MHEAHLRGRLCDRFEPETDERAKMATDSCEWDSAGRKIVGIQQAFETTSCDCNDAPKGGTALQ